jgi:hypothetical protein
MSKRLLPTTDAAAVPLATAAATLPFPPVAGQVAVVPAGWTHDEAGTVPEFEVDLWGTAALTLTLGELFAGKLRALVIADTVIDSVDHTTDTLTEAAHGWQTGDGPARFTAGTSLPGGLALATDYWLIRASANTFQVALSLALALAGTAVPLTSNGVGALTLSDTADTKRVRWGSRGLLDASIALDVDRSYTVRCEHGSDVVAYAVKGTLSAAAVTGTILPVQER